MNKGRCIECGKWLDWYDTKLIKTTGDVACAEHVGGLNGLSEGKICDDYLRIHSGPFRGFTFWSDG